MYSVSPELYQEVAARLADAVDGENYFSGSLAFRFGDTDLSLIHISEPHETKANIVCRLLLEKKKTKAYIESGLMV